MLTWWTVRCEGRLSCFDSVQEKKRVRETELFSGTSSRRVTHNESVMFGSIEWVWKIAKSDGTAGKMTSCDRSSCMA